MINAPLTQPDKFKEARVLAQMLRSGFVSYMNATWGFTLPVEIWSPLVSSTMLAAIGLVGFIARGLFKPRYPG